jgi:hypothetical protein
MDDTNIDFPLSGGKEPDINFKPWQLILMVLVLIAIGIIAHIRIH